MRCRWGRLRCTCEWGGARRGARVHLHSGVNGAAERERIEGWRSYLKGSYGSGLEGEPHDGAGRRPTFHLAEARLLEHSERAGEQVGGGAPGAPSVHGIRLEVLRPGL